MKVEETRTYVADDGTRFDTKEACAAYERSAMFKPLCNLKAADIEAILDRSTDKAKAQGLLIERLARMVAAKRIEDGDAKRRPRTEGAEAAEGETEQQEAA